jgi:hypothetical protein
VRALSRVWKADVDETDAVAGFGVSFEVVLGAPVEVAVNRDAVCGCSLQLSLS